MVGANLKYLVSILNSSLILWYFEQCAAKSGMGTTLWSKNKVEEIPVPQIENNSRKKFDTIVDKVLNAKINYKDSSALEKQIDILVYKLYDISFNEIKSINPDFWLSEEEYDNYKLE